MQMPLTCFGIKESGMHLEMPVKGERTEANITSTVLLFSGIAIATIKVSQVSPTGFWNVL